MKKILGILALMSAIFLTACSDSNSEAKEAKPEVVEAKPEVAEAKPETTEAKPETTEAKPETTEAKPEVKVDPVVYDFSSFDALDKSIEEQATKEGFSPEEGEEIFYYYIFEIRKENRKEIEFINSIEDYRAQEATLFKFYKKYAQGKTIKELKAYLEKDNVVIVYDFSSVDAMKKSMEAQGKLEGFTVKQTGDIVENYELSVIAENPAEFKATVKSPRGEIAMLGFQEKYMQGKSIKRMNAYTKKGNAEIVYDFSSDEAIEKSFEVQGELEGFSAYEVFRITQDYFDTIECENPAEFNCFKEGMESSEFDIAWRKSQEKYMQGKSLQEMKNYTEKNNPKITYDFSSEDALENSMEAQGAKEGFSSYEAYSIAESYFELIKKQNAEELEAIYKNSKSKAERKQGELRFLRKHINRKSIKKMQEYVENSSKNFYDFSSFEALEKSMKAQGKKEGFDRDETRRIVDDYMGLIKKQNKEEFDAIAFAEEFESLMLKAAVKYIQGKTIKEMQEYVELNAPKVVYDFSSFDALKISMVAQGEEEGFDTEEAYKITRSYIMAAMENETELKAIAKSHMSESEMEEAILVFLKEHIGGKTIGEIQEYVELNK